MPDLEGPSPRSRFVEAIEGACHLVDWWFTPRWRALLMWAVIPAVSFWWFRNLGMVRIRGATRAMLNSVADWVPPGMLPALHTIWSLMIATTICFGVQPLALRLGWWRSTLWILVVGCMIALERMPMVSVAVGMVGTMCVMIGRRTRPWITAPVGIGLFFLMPLLMEMFSGGDSRVLFIAWTNFLVGLALILGTSPIERREGAEPR